jgi:hypothetical protein
VSCFVLKKRVAEVLVWLVTGGLSSSPSCCSGWFYVSLEVFVSVFDAWNGAGLVGLAVDFGGLGSDFSRFGD